MSKTGLKDPTLRFPKQKINKFIEFVREKKREKQGNPILIYNFFLHK